MRSALARQLEMQSGGGKLTIRTTLLELVRVVSESADDDREVVSTVLHMLRSGRVELSGTFRDAPIDEF